MISAAALIKAGEFAGPPTAWVWQKEDAHDLNAGSFFKRLAPRKGDFFPVSEVGAASIKALIAHGGIDLIRLDEEFMLGVAAVAGEAGP